MIAKPISRKHACPRCPSGFLLFEDSEGEGNDVCINCGFREPAAAKAYLKYWPEAFHAYRLPR